jgi:hypothetical protein
VPCGACSHEDVILADSPKGYWRLGEAADPFVDFSVPGGHPGTFREWSGSPGHGTLFVRAQTGALPASDDDKATLDDAAPSGPGYPNVEGAFVRAQWGSDNSINFGNTAAFSIEAWVKPKPKVCSPGACSWNGGVLGNYRMDQSGSWNVGYGLYVSWPALTVTFARAGYVNGQDHDRLTTTESLSTAKWTHLVATYDGATMRIYFDGVEKASMPSTRNIPSTVSPKEFSIGMFRMDYGLTDYPGAFYGSIDEAAVYNYALAAAQVGKHYVAQRQNLLDTYAPELRYDQLETYRADSAATITDSYWADSSGAWTNRLLDGSNQVLAVSDPADPAENLGLGFLGSSYPIFPNGPVATVADFLDEANDHYEEDAQRLHALPLYADQIYGRVIEDSGIVVLQFWLFYYYNDPPQWFTGHHEGDWELVQIHLIAPDTPISATYAQHTTGENCSWDHVQLNGNGHPKVYVAHGTHASYFSSGNHWFNGLVPILDHAGGEASSAPSVLDITVDPPSWLDWPGSWGASDSSPGGPSHQGDNHTANAKWLDPLEWSESANECTEGQTQPRVPRLPQAPKVIVTRKGEMVVIRYTIDDDAPGDGARPVGLITSVDSAGATYPPLTFVSRIRAEHGGIVRPLGLGKGPYEVRVGVIAASGARSRLVTVRIP